MKACNAAFLLLFACKINAQKPEQIYPNAREHKSIEYLLAQSAAWQKETKKDPKNANAWYNYYYANRNLGFNDTTRTYEAKQEVINKILAEMEKAIPETYEFNLVKWQAGMWNMKLISYLEKAEKLGPDRAEHLDYSIVRAEMKGDIRARDMWSKKKFEAGMFSNGLLYYNYNVLAGLPKNAILITSGDNDTYPIWYLQSLGVRTDVTIVHTALVYLADYRKQVFAKLGIQDWEEKEGAKPEDLIAHVSKNTKENPVALGMTAAHCLKKTALENMYLTGLAYLHSEVTIDNVAVLRRNFEQEYALDYIDKPLFSEISPQMVKNANGNYVVPMLKLLEHYRSAGDKQKSEWISNKLLTIVKDTEDEGAVKKRIAEIN